MYTFTEIWMHELEPKSKPPWLWLQRLQRISMIFPLIWVEEKYRHTNVYIWV